ncbi:Tom7-domain-containing protein [Ramicandelaber brevisporus]|nr:Tom7-domain-containing protein [Ramicandelaber brevisporus]
MNSDDAKEFVLAATGVAKRVVHYGWIPMIVAIGYFNTTPRPPIARILSPLAM